MFSVVLERCRRSRERTARHGKLSSVLWRGSKGLATMPAVAHEARMHLPEEHLVVVVQQRFGSAVIASVGRQVLGEEAAELALAAGLPERHGQLMELL